MPPEMVRLRGLRKEDYSGVGQFPEAFAA